MPRRAAAVRREVMPDAVYNNRLVTQLINKVLLDGKKATAERIVYGAFDIVARVATHIRGLTFLTLPVTRATTT